MELGSGRIKLKQELDSKPKVRELTPGERKVAMSLEFFRYLDIKDRIFLVLVWSGLKRASPVSLELNEPNQGLEEVAKNAGLFFKPTDHELKEPNRGLRKGRVCFVAKKESDLERISELWFKDEENPEISTELGRMSGYPETAIVAHNKLMSFPPAERDNVKETKESPVLSEKEKIDWLKNKKDQELIPFSFLFHMSKPKVDNEKEVVRKWVEELKTVAPSLYIGFIVDFNQKNKFGLTIKSTLK